MFSEKKTKKGGRWTQLMHTRSKFWLVPNRLSVHQSTQIWKTCTLIFKFFIVPIFCDPNKLMLLLLKIQESVDHFWEKNQGISPHYETMKWWWREEKRVLDSDYQPKIFFIKRYKECSIDKITLKTKIEVIPLHLFSLHFCWSLAGPTQFAPPYAGLGLSHLRLLVFVPPPQFFVQVVKPPQFPQLPSTGKNEESH